MGNDEQRPFSAQRGEMTPRMGIQIDRSSLQVMTQADIDRMTQER